MIRTSGDVDGRGLMAWLAMDPVAREVTFSVAPGAAHEMGAGEIIQAVFDNVIALGGLVTGVAAYVETRRARRAAPPAASPRPSEALEVRLECGGATEVVRGNDPAEIARIVEALRRAAEQTREDGS
ncbi:hypothetical protein [Actinomadura sp. WMMB 499]|uniref:effector-associated constant component EACC1 n=1 Tax=Actinomadura sp. WMMB 499 TaxID=1219491 RepID=UPI0020C7727B|nr:hypothetical protein [Actinomadura sp. WMMB 499]